MGIESGKQKQEIEKSAFAEYLNKDLEERHKKIFTGSYKQKYLYFDLVQNKDKPQTSKEMKNRFFDVMECENVRSHYYNEY